MIITPVLLFVLMLIVQTGLYFHAQNVAENAAQVGAAAGRRFDGTEADAAKQARTYLDEVAATILLHQSVLVSRDPEIATVTVRGSVISLVPGISLDVTQSAAGPVERFVPPSGEFANSEGANRGN